MINWPSNGANVDRGLLPLDVSDASRRQLQTQSDQSALSIAEPKALIAACGSALTINLASSLNW